MHRRSLPPLWVLWVPLVWLVSSPWVGFTGTPQWDRIHPVPFTDPADRLRDVTLNVLLFVPFGLSAGWGRPFVRGITRAASLAVLVSLSAEAMQLFSTRRYPSATDITSALAGAVLGAAAARLMRNPARLQIRTGER